MKDVFHWKKEHDEFIRANAPGIKRNELTQKFNEHFALNLKETQIIAYMKNHGIKNGIDCRFKKGWPSANKGRHMSQEQYERCKATMFKKGHSSRNKMAIGTEIVVRDGYVKIKVAEPDKWRFKHRLVWEENFGKVPRGYCVTFKDGNPQNCSVDNLILMSKGENAVINKHNLFVDGNRETGILTAKLILAINERSRENDG